MTTTPIAIPQTYKRVRFRSTLEANWARTLDAWGIAWSYEPEAFSLPSGASYLPDFHLPQINTWLEVKGPGVGGIEKFREFAAARCRPTASTPESMSADSEMFVAATSPTADVAIFSVVCIWCSEWVFGDYVNAYPGACFKCQRVQFSTRHSPGCGMDSRCIRSECHGEKVSPLPSYLTPFIWRQWQPYQEAGVRR